MDLIVLIVTCIINLVLGAFVLSRNPRTGFARAFAIMSILICAWIISNYVTELSSIDIAINNLANKAAFMSGYGIILSGLVFTYFFPVKRLVQRSEALIVSFVSLYIICLSASPLIAGYVTLGRSGDLQFSFGPLLWLYIAGFLGLLILIARNALRPSLKWQKNQRVQAQLVLVAFFVSALLGLLLNVILPLLSDGWETTKFGPLVTIILVGTIVYAIAKHGLFDVRFVVVRTVAYGLSLGALAVIYYLLAYAISWTLFSAQSTLIYQSPVNIGIALILSFLFQPIKRFFDQITNRFFYRDNYDSGDFYALLNRTLTSTTDLHLLLKRAATDIATTLKTEQAFFVVHRQSGHHASAGTVRHSRLPIADIRYLDSYVQKRGGGEIVASLLLQGSKTRRLMVSHRIELVLPLVLSDTIIGYLCLGEQQSSGFSHRDINVLQTISDELVIAIQNALSIQEVRELNATLQQRINEATHELRASNAQLQRLDKAKDEFVGMASHQLRTPLTSVKGYISMVIEGDAGKITDAQKHLLEEAFTSSERMVHLINDFLNVSRLQTGKFIIDKRPTNLAKVVEQEIDSLSTTAASRNLSFSYSLPKDFPLLDLDEGKIRQVIMNFADNALYYSAENTTIHVKLTSEDDTVVFTVKDTGIGVPLAEQAELFTKFYRASNARKQRPDGTGVGLFLAKKVIDAHGGKVLFESVEGQGSTFGFHLPLEKLRSVDNAN